MISADDLRYFLAVAKHRRLNLAADELRVDHTTVGRRISALEHALGQRLFDRSARGWELTPSGGLLVEPAESVAAAMTLALDAVGRRGKLLQGRVRVACPDGFGAWLFAPAIGELSRSNPDLTVEIITATGRHLPLTVRDFDVAVSLEEPNDGARVIKSYLTPFVMRLYATPEYLKSAPIIRKIEDLERHTLIWFVDRLMDVESLRAVHDALPKGVRVQSTNIAAIWQAAAAGVGVAPLPVFMADPDPRLVRILPNVEFRSDYWLILPREHANLARTQAVARVIESLVIEKQLLITGKQVGSK